MLPLPPPPPSTPPLAPLPLALSNCNFFVPFRQRTEELEEKRDDGGKGERGDLGKKTFRLRLSPFQMWRASISQN